MQFNEPPRCRDSGEVHCCICLTKVFILFLTNSLLPRIACPTIFSAGYSALLSIPASTYSLYFLCLVFNLFPHLSVSHSVLSQSGGLFFPM